MCAISTLTFQIAARQQHLEFDNPALGDMHQTCIQGSRIQVSYTWDLATILNKITENWIKLLSDIPFVVMQSKSWVRLLLVTTRRTAKRSRIPILLPTLFILVVVITTTLALSQYEITKASVSSFLWVQAVQQRPTVVNISHDKGLKLSSKDKLLSSS